ncbi:Tropomodulin [Sarcoptes scabiei]|nr:Tropomodulin [Sarcoptes scabiei]
MLDAVPESLDFSQAEEDIFKFWTDVDAFRTSVKQSAQANRPAYVFYDGPPFATGLPHYGHILAGTIKDIVLRWAHMSGYHVERRFGWDTHGLPIEFEIDKTLNIKSPDDVMMMGIKAYNDECRKIVMRYSDAWRKIILRLGRWIDFDNDYKTLYPEFMESVWWIFKQMFNKGLVYNGVKVMPYSSACSTPLSNFESGQNYKEVVDPAVIISFPLVNDPTVSLLAWTTTPWTLPSNLLVCVNPDLEYFKIKDKKTQKLYIILGTRLNMLYKKPEEECEIIERFCGLKLQGLHYQPLFDYFADYGKSINAFVVACDNYVTSESGTGLVHCAPFFGEDDYRVAIKIGVVTKDGKVVCPIDSKCCFIEPVTDFIGKYVKDADKDIIKMLKSKDRLVRDATTKHSYPFCWRSDTPLIYRAVSSWFVRVEQFSQMLVETNKQTHWVPDFIKEKRFGNWLREARDWAISRNRYWGTPIPLWVSEDMQEVVCIGSIKELEDLSGVRVTDLHRENVDPIEIPSKRPGMPPLRRVSEVFDCWFESGSMPYAQSHYPFENKKLFEENFPANFIAEGVDQTRGWFYTLLVISTLLFGKPPFKNLIANGLVLASDGQKMSKRKKNYPDPLEIVKKYGADALRLYLINSPAVRAENLRFREEGVRDLLKDVFIPWFNAYRFLVQNIFLYEQTNPDKRFQYDKNNNFNSDNIMDRWILSFTQSLFKFIKKEMKAYRLYTVVPKLVKFFDNLTNWYVRMNRKRLKGDFGERDTRQALDSLFSVLFCMLEMMAPFTPFITDYMYQNLKKVIVTETAPKTTQESIHYLMHSSVIESLIDIDVERKVSFMQTVIDLGRLLRDRRNMPLKYPLPEIVVITNSQQTIDDIQSLKQFILDELNVRDLKLSMNKEEYGVQLSAEPDIKSLGIKLRNESKKIIQAIRELSDERLMQYQLNPDNFVVEGYCLQPGEMRIRYKLAETGLDRNIAEKYEADSQNGVLVLLNVCADSKMIDEGTAREIINRVQKLRKEAKLAPTDPIRVYYKVLSNQDDKSSPSLDLNRICYEFNEFIKNSLKSEFINLEGNGGKNEDQLDLITRSICEIKGEKIELFIESISSIKSESNDMFVKFKNLELKIFDKIVRKTILLENPCGTELDDFIQTFKDWKLSAEQDKPVNEYLNIKAFNSNDGGVDAIAINGTILLRTIIVKDDGNVEILSIKTISQLKEAISVALNRSPDDIRELYSDCSFTELLLKEQNFSSFDGDDQLISKLSGRTAYLRI